MMPRLTDEKGIDKVREEVNQKAEKLKQAEEEFKKAQKDFDAVQSQLIQLERIIEEDKWKNTIVSVGNRQVAHKEVLEKVVRLHTKFQSFHSEFNQLNNKYAQIIKIYHESDQKHRQVKYTRSLILSLQKLLDVGKKYHLCVCRMGKLKLPPKDCASEIIISKHTKESPAVSEQIIECITKFNALSLSHSHLLNSIIVIDACLKDKAFRKGLDDCMSQLKKELQDKFKEEPMSIVVAESATIGESKELKEAPLPSPLQIPPTPAAEFKSPLSSVLSSSKSKLSFEEMCREFYRVVDHIETIVGILSDVQKKKAQVNNLKKHINNIISSVDEASFDFTKISLCTLKDNLIKSKNFINGAGNGLFDSPDEYTKRIGECITKIEKINVEQLAKISSKSLDIATI